jgi:hypothetical protein
MVMHYKKGQRFEHYTEWTQARFWTFIRSALRAAWTKYPVKARVLNKAKRKYTGDNKRRKWSYLCAQCNLLFKGDQVNVHHKEEVGQLKCYADLPEFVRKMFCGEGDLEVLCKKCHKKQHKK